MNGPKLGRGLFLFVVARPLGSTLSLIGSLMDHHQRSLSAWLGLRGVSAFYYLLFSLENAGYGVVGKIMPIILLAIVIFPHGASVTVLLDRYVGKRD
ncbi:hypothetical protein QCE63_33815 [Caballeronia sp. LZ065]|uniref:hypothetical protein n=1 Tax=Caballeronia sp. LZ065 TaxID=3038571 RepID=UPI002857B202|nr:hypothetical protein [Caballeronia sp. LZ065]MDR5784402.1 hypothetical protein [Caballeronia sp. LZ065]